jgi:YjbE family integral membrane protein
VLTSFAAGLLAYPYLKLGGGLLLLWIGIKLMLPEGDDDHDVAASDHLWGAVRTVIVADFVMSLDNVVAVAAAARDHLGLLIFGLAVSIPLIVWSSQLIMKLMDRFPSVVTFGAGLIGYVGGEMAASDALVRESISPLVPAPEQTAGLFCAVIVISVGWWLARRANQRAQARLLNEGDDGPVAF